MQRITLRMKHAQALVIAVMLATGPAFADKPQWAGDNNEQKHRQKEMRKSPRGHEERIRDTRPSPGRDERRTRGDGYFGDRQRIIIHDYYAGQYRGGRCPPGLAKKHNGCMPPGQAKKWRIGYPLPRDVIYYDLPSAVIVRLGPPPAGHRYVRVAADILLIAVGTGLVVDAIQDLGGM